MFGVLMSPEKNREAINKVMPSNLLHTRTEPQVAFLITNVRGTKLLRDCLDSVIKTAYGAFKVVVVDSQTSGISSFLKHAPSDVIRFLQERGLGEMPSGILSFVDAFHETVGLSTAGGPDTVGANCGDLTSIEIAISKLQNKIRKS